MDYFYNRHQDDKARLDARKRYQYNADLCKYAKEATGLLTAGLGLLLMASKVVAEVRK